MDENNYCLDLWGGSHCYNKFDETYYISRIYGLFSNLNVLTYGILKFTLEGYIPKNISLKLLEYDYETNYYNHLFKISDEDFKLNDIDKTLMDYQMRYCEPNLLGIGRTKLDLNFNILNRVYNKYFALSDEVNQHIKEIESKHIKDYSNTLLIWARKTDKVAEVIVPDVEDYINLINRLNLKHKDIILQTDDISVYNDFMSKGLECKVLNELPYSNDNTLGFHNHLSSITNDVFFKKYNMSKKYYLQRILALVHVASKCNTLIIYPGNLATYIPIIRGNWNNVYSYKDKYNLIS